MWKKLKISPYYSINEYGEIKRNSYTRIDKLGRKTEIEEKRLSPQLDKDGYLKVWISTGLEKAKACSIHRLVAEAFIPNIEKMPCVNHKDENKLNNNIDNLEWCSIAYNNCYGSKIERGKIKQGKPILMLDGNNTKEFCSANEAGRYLKKSNAGNIIRCANGFLKSAYGYKWKWKEVV